MATRREIRAHIASNLEISNPDLVQQLRSLGYDVDIKAVQNYKYRIGLENEDPVQRGARLAAAATVEDDTKDAAAQARKAPHTPPNRPRAGSFSEFVVGLPYELPADLVMEWGIEAGFEITTIAAVHTCRRKYQNLRKRHKAGVADMILAQSPEAHAKMIAAAAKRRLDVERLRELRRETPPTPAATKPEPTPEPVAAQNPGPGSHAIERAGSAARQQLVALIMRIGLEETEKLIEEFRAFNARLVE